MRPASRARRSIRRRIRHALRVPRQVPTVSVASARFLQPIEPADQRKPGPRIVLLNDCRDQVNFGANALVDGLIEILRQAVPTATISPIPSHWIIDASRGLGAFVDGGKGLRQPRATYPVVADEFEAIADNWVAGTGGPGAAELMARLREADLVVINGEGSIYRTNLSASRELFLGWLAKERLNVPTIFVNGLVHLTDVMPVLPAMVRRTFPLLDAVAVREPYSLRNLEQYVPEVSAQVFPDAAFVFTPDDAALTPQIESIRADIGDSPYYCFDPGPMPMDHKAPKRSGLYQLISALNEIGPRPVFVTNGPADGFIRRVAEETGALYIDTIVDYHEFMALVGGAEFLATGRYHNVILAAIMGCPSVAFASASHKVHGACEMLDGLVGTPYDGTYLRPRIAAIQQQASSYVENRNQLRDQLMQICRRRRFEALEIGELAARVLNVQATAARTMPQSARP